MARERVLIAVKTYPTLSSKYQELVCSAGVREDGSLVWIYPLPFKRDSFGRQFKKFEWLELELAKHEKDFRKESFHPVGRIRAVGSVSSKGNWSARKKLLLGKVYNNLETLLAEAKDRDTQKRTSLAVFRPTEIRGFGYRKCEREWNSSRLSELRQGNLFEKQAGSFEVIRKLPYQFYYRFADCRGRVSKLMVQDWELGDCYWRALEQNNGNEQRACELVKRQYFDKLIARCEVYFILGTTLEFQAKNAPNPFIIAGIFAPPREKQLRFAGF